MNLVDLNPQWLMHEGARIGMIFRCPLEPGNDRRWQSVFFEATPQKQQFEAVIAAIGENSGKIVQLCNTTTAWTSTPAAAEATFENISIQPSIDGSAGGNWHGRIRAGECVDA